MTLRAEAVLFDKDGTLFDFHTTWSHWAHEVLHDLAAGDAALVARLAETVDYDLAARRFRPTSPVIAGTNREAAECLASALPGRDVAAIEDHLMLSAAQAPLAPAVPLGLHARLKGEWLVRLVDSFAANNFAASSEQTKEEAEA